MYNYQVFISITRTSFFLTNLVPINCEFTAHQPDFTVGVRESSIVQAFVPSMLRDYGFIFLGMMLTNFFFYIMETGFLLICGVVQPTLKGRTERFGLYKKDKSRKKPPFHVDDSLMEYAWGISFPVSTNWCDADYVCNSNICSLLYAFVDLYTC